MMIQQPVLGKKVADRRKEKGLTQEDLVEMCNLSVRTLQRIEAGEVTPRVYTVKLIFVALELDFENSLNNKSKRMTGVQKKWLEQFYINITDLFNLKTNTMKKVSIFSIITVATIFGIFSISNKTSAQDNFFAHVPNTEHTESISNKDLPFYDFSCYGCMEEKGMLIGRDISFTLKGVQVTNVRLMAIERETQNFNALFIKGQFFERKVIAEYKKDWLINGSLKYSADRVDETGTSIILKGNARVYDLNDFDNPADDESIEAKEIVINLI